MKQIPLTSIWNTIRASNTLTQTSFGGLMSADTHNELPKDKAAGLVPSRRLYSPKGISRHQSLNTNAHI